MTNRIVFTVNYGANPMESITVTCRFENCEQHMPLALVDRHAAFHGGGIVTVQTEDLYEALTREA